MSKYKEAFQLLGVICFFVVLLIMYFVNRDSKQGVSDDNQEYKYAIYEIDIDEDLVRNNHVGNDWSIVYWINDIRFYSGEEITVPIGKEIEIEIRITEDDSYPDTASTVATFSLYNKATKTVKLTVMEDNGRYAGNTATWEITFNASLVRKIGQ